MDAAQLADDLKAQLELAQKKLHDFQEEIVENRVTREKEMFNFKRTEVYTSCAILQYLSALVSVSLYIELAQFATTLLFWASGFSFISALLGVGSFGFCPLKSDNTCGAR